MTNNKLFSNNSHSFEYNLILLLLRNKFFMSLTEILTNLFMLNNHLKISKYFKQSHFYILKMIS